MLTQIIRWSLSRAWFLTAVAAALFLAGAWYVRDLPVEVFPALAPARMVVQTEAEGLVADQVEQIVTRPLETALIGAPGLASVRSESVSGLSLITLDLAKGADPGRVRQTVAERLPEAVLPQGVGAPRIAPLTSATGDILVVGLTSDKLDAMALRDLVQREVRPKLLATAGVANVAVYGGRTRRIEVRARPGDLSDSDLGFQDVIGAVRRATSVTGAGFIDTPQQRVLIDPRGQALTADQVGAAQIQIVGSAPTHVTDVADVVDAPAPAFGDALIGGKPGVLVSVVSQYGAHTLETTRAVQAAVEQLRPGLQARGVTVSVNADTPAQSIDGAIRGLVIGLVIAGIVVCLILFVVLGDPLAVLAVLFSIAPSLLAALAVLKLLGLTLNVMTLGGLFIASAIVIDDAVIDIESIVTLMRAAPDDKRSRVHAIFDALMEVRAPVLYATLLIDIALTPLVFLGGVFGPFLAPLAITIVMASLTSLVVAACLTPATALLLLHRLEPRPEHPPVAQLKALYGRWIDRHCEGGGLATIALIVAALVVVVILPLARRTDVPSFHDGRLIVHVQAPAATSLDAMGRMGGALIRTGLALPGVQAASDRIGRDPTDFSAWGTDQSDIELDLKPGLAVADQEQAQARLTKALADYPDVTADIRTGLGQQRTTPEDQAPFAVRVSGPDLDQVDAAAEKIAQGLRGLPDAGQVDVQAGPRAPSVRIDLNFKRLAIFGLSAADVLETVQTAFSGKTVAQVYVNGRAVDLTVTGPDTLKRDPEGIGELLLRSSSGLSTPLRSVANVYLTDTRSVIRHDAGLPTQVVTADPSPGRARAFGQAARAFISAHVALPPGAYLTYADANAAAAGDRRALAANSAIAAIAMVALLILVFRDWRMAALILLSTVFAFLGGAIAVVLTGGVLSVGSITGFIALFGLSTRSAILLVSRPGDVAAARKVEWTLDIVKETAVERAAPILLTSLLVIVVIAPLALSRGQVGAEILGPMADVILGGALSGAILTLLFLPALIHAHLCPHHRGRPWFGGRDPGHDHGHDHHHEH